MRATRNNISVGDKVKISIKSSFYIENHQGIDSRGKLLTGIVTYIYTDPGSFWALKVKWIGKEDEGDYSYHWEDIEAEQREWEE